MNASPRILGVATFALMLAVSTAIQADETAAPAGPQLKSVAKTDESGAESKPVKQADKPRIVVGRIEYVVLQDVHIKLKARIDTGAGLSSVHARILEITRTPEGERVRFQIADGQGGHKTLSRKVVEWVNIKVMGSDQRNRRPVVRLDVCLGGKRLEGRVTLSDRGGFLYPVLIGRNLLNTGKFLVDPDAKYLREPGCE